MSVSITARFWMAKMYLCYCVILSLKHLNQNPDNSRWRVGRQQSTSLLTCTHWQTTRQHIQNDVTGESQLSVKHHIRDLRGGVNTHAVIHSSQNSQHKAQTH